VGHAGFHTRPDPVYLAPFTDRGVEMGYTVQPSHRRRGYAREAVEGMTAWARSHGVDRFVLSIRPDNTASTAMAAALGFRVVGGADDSEDGWEEIWLLDVGGRAAC
jgi:[ribosomal protein S5]-alanine N-acetyltransferase